MAYTFCLLAVAVVLVAFLTFGIMNVTIGQAYYNCNKKLGRKEFGNSFAAATASLATVLFYFVVLGLENGLWILLISPLSLFLGTLLFNFGILPRLVRQKYGISKEGEITAGNTLGEYIKQRYDSQIVKYVILGITLLGIISIMLIELFVGVEIFDIFLKNGYRWIALIFISIVSFIYTGLGGLNAVIKTDKIQYWFMTITAFILIVYLLFNYTEPISNLTWNDYVPTMFGKDGLWHSSWALFTNTIIVNIFLIPSLLRNWQLIAATKNDKEIRKGMWVGVLLTTIVSLLFLLFGIYFYNIFPISPGSKPSLNDILTTMAGSGDLVLSYILFPLLFVACLMALLSTVDSSLLPIVQSLVVDILPSSYKEKKFINIKCILSILALTLFLYFIIFQFFQFNLLNWLFTIFSLVTISSPAILFGCFGNETILQTKWMKYSVVIFTIIGLIAALYLSFDGNRTKNIVEIQLNTPFAVLSSSFILLIIYIILYISKSKTLKKQ